MLFENDEKLNLTESPVSAESNTTENPVEPDFLPSEATSAAVDSSTEVSTLPEENAVNTENENLETASDFTETEATPPAEAEEIDPEFSDSDTEENSSLSFDEQVLTKIAFLALGNIEGILPVSSGGIFTGLKSALGMHGNNAVSAQVNNASVSITLNVVLEYGKSAPKIFAKVKEAVAGEISTLTGLSVTAVNVKVLDVLSHEEFQRRLSSQ